MRLRLHGALFLLVLQRLAAQQLPSELSTMNGVVLDATTRAPVPGVRVTGPGVQVVGPSIEVLTVTNAIGEYRIENIYPGPVLVTYRKTGYIAQTLPFNFIAGMGTNAGSILLQPTGVVTGRITASHGEAASSVLVTLMGYRARNGGREMVRIASTLSDDRGEYRMIDIPAGHYIITYGTSSPVDESQLPKRIYPTIYPRGSQISSAELIELRGGENLRLRDAQLESDQGILQMDFVNDRGEPAKDVSFQLSYRTPYSDSTTADATTFPASKFHIEAGENVTRKVWPGLFGVYILAVNWTANDGSSQFLARPIDFDGQTQTAQIMLSPPKGHLKIRAIVQQSDGRTSPLASARIGICQAATSACASPGFWVSRVSSTSSSMDPVLPGLASDGSLDLPPVDPGTYELYSVPVPGGFYVSAARQGERDSLMEGILISENSPQLEIVVRPSAGILRGTVRNRQGSDIPYAMVALLPEPPLDKAKLQTLRRAVQTDTSGAFELQNIVPGSYTAYAWIGLQSDAYLDAGFVAKYADFGVPVRITTEGTISLIVLNEP